MRLLDSAIGDVEPRTAIRDERTLGDRGPDRNTPRDRSTVGAATGAGRMTKPEREVDWRCQWLASGDYFATKPHHAGPLGSECAEAADIPEDDVVGVLDLLVTTELNLVVPAAD